jgi:hypothetical protein
MNRCLNRSLFITLALSGCATAPVKSETVSPAKPLITKVACEPRDRKITPTPAPFLVESFRCSMQPGRSLNVGIRVYSSLDSRENSIIYGPERMDTAPIANDSILYNGVKVLLAGTAEGTQYSFQHEKLSLQIRVPRSAPDTSAFEAIYSDDAGAAGIKGFCVRVSPVTF